MPCDPNTLISDARCLEACIPTQMLSAVQVSLLCQILDAGGGGGGGGVDSFNARTGAVTLELGDVSAVADSRYVLKSGDTMTGPLVITGPLVVASDPVLGLSQTWNNAGVAFTAIKLNVTNTASSIVSKLIDLQVGGATQFNVERTGNVTCLGGFTVAGGGFLSFSNRTGITSPANGNLLFRNAATTDFSLLQLGGTTSAFPSIKRSAALLQARLADDSAYCDFESRVLRVATPFTVATLPAAGTQGRIAYVTDALAPAFLAIVVGGGAIITTVFDNGTNWVAV